jgi:hypothetical protein
MAAWGKKFDMTLRLGFIPVHNQWFPFYRSGG